jgi:hypothetical protein
VVAAAGNQFRGQAAANAIDLKRLLEIKKMRFLTTSQKCIHN